MGQKSNPISLRLEKTNQHWSNCWYGDYNYATQFLQDLQINAYFQNCSQQLKRIPPILYLKHQRGEMQIALFSPRPIRTLFPYGLMLRQRSSPGGKGARIVARTPAWYAREKAKRNKLHQLNAQLSSTSAAANPAPGPLKGTFLRGLPSRGTPLVSTKLLSSNRVVPGKKSVWAGIRSLLFAAQLGIMSKDEISLKNPFLLNKLQHIKTINTTQHSQHSMHYAYLACLQVCLASQVKESATKKIFPQGFSASQSQATLLNRGKGSLLVKGDTFAKTFPGRNKHVGGAKSINMTHRMLDTPLKNRFESCITTINGIALHASQGTHLFLRNSIFGGYKCKVHLFKCFSTNQNPSFIASRVVFLLQERVPFRQLKHKLIQELIQERKRNKIIKGVRISCSGRVAARSKKAQKARTDSIQWGETGLNVFSESVHFASKSAQTTYGKLGVKVWICYSFPQKK